MKTTKSVARLFCLVLLLSGCFKDRSEIKDGTYKGTFTVMYTSDTLSGKTTLELRQGRFSCTRNPNRIPAGGSGTFTTDNNTITFNDESGWTADFDWNLILHGKYEYTYNGKKLIITANKNQVGNYTYDLVKQ
jgi:hypothetical protein